MSGEPIPPKSPAVALDAADHPKSRAAALVPADPLVKRRELRSLRSLRSSVSGLVQPAVLALGPGANHRALASPAGRLAGQPLFFLRQFLILFEAISYFFSDGLQTGDAYFFRQFLADVLKKNRNA